MDRRVLWRADIRGAGAFGITVPEPEISGAGVQAHVMGAIAQIAPRDSVESFEKYDVRVIQAEAEVTGVPVAELRGAYEKQVSMRTFVEGRDIAAMAVFLASPAARYVNGQTIAVDGGLETLRNTWRT